MRAVLLLVFAAALAAPCFSLPTPEDPSDFWLRPIQQAKEVVQRVVENVKAQVDQLLSQGNKEQIEKVINEAAARLKKVFEIVQSLTGRIPGLGEKVKEAVAKAKVALEKLKEQAKEALKQENQEKVKAALREALAKVIDNIKASLQQLFPPKQA